MKETKIKVTMEKNDELIVKKREVSLVVEAVFS